MQVIIEALLNLPTKKRLRTVTQMLQVYKTLISQPSTFGGCYTIGSWIASQPTPNIPPSSVPQVNVLPSSIHILFSIMPNNWVTWDNSRKSP